MSLQQEPSSGIVKRKVGVPQRFLVMLAMFALLSNVVVNVLSLYTDMLGGFVLGSLTWAYVLGIGQFVIAIGVGHVYLFVANRGDVRLAAEARS